MPHTEAEFKGDVIFCLVFVYVPCCSPPSPLRFISSGNISKFCCMEAFARGCALTIRTQVSRDNAVKTQARGSLKQTTKGLKQIEKKQKQVHQIAQTPESGVRGTAEEVNIQILAQQSWQSTSCCSLHSLPWNREIERLWNKAPFISAAPPQKKQWPDPGWQLNTTSMGAAELLRQHSQRQLPDCSQVPQTQSPQNPEHQHEAGKL